mgnify:CR=1 FL=1
MPSTLLTRTSLVFDRLQEIWQRLATQRRVASTLVIVFVAGLALVASMLIGIVRGQPFDELFVAAVAFAVAAIPTGLPAVVTTILSMGTRTLSGAPTMS